MANIPPGDEETPSLGDLACGPRVSRRNYAVRMREGPDQRVEVPPILSLMTSNVLGECDRRRAATRRSPDRRDSELAGRFPR